ncbi:unnamed protein product [Kuraishia capsulata CBS 1993]|uniref:Cysteine proteinase 1, mitochondrial n=1 Tax=Kuraishia capsulata CBS 1993 TaxID=1382522 RepID=W6MJ33_9ASCO|nr:uncharacterized protein KUCA_T00001939001 [Kuraishia capsulata CBS 1993]CDK25968.1 unnamed protein product [Kuraishia capsulata CBS 1993]
MIRLRPGQLKSAKSPSQPFVRLSRSAGLKGSPTGPFFSTLSSVPFHYNRRKLSQNTKMDLKVSTLSEWTSDFKQDKVSLLAGTVLRQADADEVLINRDAYIKHLSNIYSHKIEQEGSPITSQKASGRCWLFAATNCLRIPMMKRYNLKTFQLSTSFLFFYDKLEKCNFFLDQISDTYKEDVDSRLVQFLLDDPTCDGGQFDMFINIVDKYGLVPNTVFPDTFNTTLSRKLNWMLKTKLREFAEILREDLAAGKPIDAVKASMQRELHKYMCMYLGTPPGPNDEFLWEYEDKDGKYHSLKSTPIKFLKESVEFDSSNFVSLLNDPRNEYDKLVKIDRLGNVVGAPTVSYLNVDIKKFTEAAVDRIKKGKPVFFGSHTPIYMDRKRGYMDQDLWSYDLIGFKTEQTKASRVRYHQSLMTHAMVLTAVHLNEEGKPVRWRVENSWGKDVGFDGYFIMTQEYLEDYVYQVVVEKSDLPANILKIEQDPSPIVLPPYDPMGALATFRTED